MLYAHELIEHTPAIHMIFHWAQYGILVALTAFSFRMLKKIDYKNDR